MTHWRNGGIKYGAGWVLLILPVLLGATTLEDSRRIEEEKRRQLRPSEAALERRTTSPPDQAVSGAASRYADILSKPLVSFADGEQLVALLTRDEREFAQHTDAADNDPLTRGQLGLMLCDALNIQGGLTRRLLPESTRYAHKELVYRGIMLPGSSREYVSGKELVVSIIQAINYLTEDGS